ncbi:hypothetical protein BGX33_001298 [Mortierella sp. NVP41]|nr:hypothetical protein BGX33_001298 [Mortierella sp. NVP41]
MNTDGLLDVHDVIESEWVCTKLEHFGCQIRNIARPDITRFICDQGPSDFTIDGTLQESLDLQRGVYSQLGRLTRLRILALGSRYDTIDADYGTSEPYWQYDCLAMNLDSGLDLLKDLKELQYLALPDMETDFCNGKEQVWVTENWPDFVKMRLWDHNKNQ